MGKIWNIGKHIGLAAALALSLGLAATALAAGNQAPAVDAGVAVAGREGSAYGPGDVAVLSATVTNVTGGDLSGTLRLDFPAGVGEIISVPALEPDGNGGYLVEGLEPGGSVTAAVSILAGDTQPVTDWALTATFTDGSGLLASDTAEASFGLPKLKASRDGIVRDGVVRIWNDGNGGAGHVKFRFLAKNGWKNGDGLGSGMRYAGGGYIEVDMGAIAAGGSVERDISGLLHQRMDRSHDFCIVYGEGGSCAMPADGWED